MKCPQLRNYLALPTIVMLTASVGKPGSAGKLNGESAGDWARDMLAVNSIIVGNKR